MAAICVLVWQLRAHGGCVSAAYVCVRRGSCICLMPPHNFVLYYQWLLLSRTQQQQLYWALRCVDSLGKKLRKSRRLPMTCCCGDVRSICCACVLYVPYIGRYRLCCCRGQVQVLLLLGALVLLLDVGRGPCLTSGPFCSSPLTPTPCPVRLVGMLLLDM